MNQAVSSPSKGLSPSILRFERRLLRSWLGLFSIKPTEASFSARGFPEHERATRRRLELIGETFVASYNRTLSGSHDVDLRREIEAVDPDLRGFAVEGAAMGAAIADAALMRDALLRTCLASMRETHPYLVHVGAGWAMARVPWRRRAILAALDPLYRPLAYDGMGFHDAYFYTQKVMSGWARLRSGYAARAYDQGIGRALWFVGGGNAAHALAALEGAAIERRADLWSGLGLALCYAGGASDADLEHVRLASGPYRSCLQQGAAFAAEAHVRAGVLPPDRARSIETLTGLGGEQAAHLVRDERDALSLTDCSDGLSYEHWRAAVQRHFAARSDPSRTARTVSSAF